MLSFLSLLALAGAASAEPASLVEGQFAQTRFKFNRPAVVRLAVQTCNSKGQVKAIKMRVQDGGMQMTSLEVVYESGAREILTGSHKLEKGQATDWLQLGNSSNPCLAEMFLHVRASNPGPMTSVVFLGDWEK